MEDGKEGAPIVWGENELVHGEDGAGFLRDDAVELPAQVSKSTSSCHQAGDFHLLHISCLLDKQNKPLEGVEREGCAPCLRLPAHSEELRKQGHKLEKSLRVCLSRQKGVEAIALTEANE